MEKGKIKIICDTNIWYDLGNGVSFINTIEDYNLCCTFLNLYELIHTDMLKINFNKVQKACNAIFNFASCFILEPPYLHLKNLLYPYHLEYSKTNFIEAIRTLINLERLDNDMFTELGNYLEIKDDTLNKFFVKHITDEINKTHDFFNLDIVNRAQYKKDIKTFENRKKKINNIRKQIITELNNVYPLIDNNSFNDSFWENINVYINARMHYFQKLKLYPNMNPEKNDAVDMLNLIYVNENCLYWTKDNRWKTILSETKLGQYLFTPE